MANNKCIELKKEKQQQQLQIKTLELEMINIRKRNKESIIKYNDINNNYNKLSKVKQELNENINRYSDKINSLTKELNEMEQNYKIKCDEFGDSKECNNQFGTKHNELNTHLLKYETLINNLQSEIGKLNIKINQTNNGKLLLLKNKYSKRKQIDETTNLKNIINLPINENKIREQKQQLQNKHNELAKNIKYVQTELQTPNQSEKQYNKLDTNLNGIISEIYQFNQGY